MIIFIHGEDTFRAKEKAKEMKARFQEKFDPTGLNFLEFKTRPEIGEAMNAITASPFMGERRMVLFHELLSGLKKAELESWTDALTRTPESTIVVCCESKEPPTLAGVEVHLYAFPLLTEREVPRWIADRSKAMGMAIDQAAVQELAVRVGADLWRMQGELEKLHSSLPVSKEETVGVDRVRALVASSFDDQLFDLVDALSRRDKAAAMQLLHEQRHFGTTDAHVLAMLMRQLRILLAARALLDENPRADKHTLASLMALHPFVAQKAMQQVRGFTLHALKELHTLLFDFERKLKSGNMDFDIAVDLTAASFLREL